MDKEIFYKNIKLFLTSLGFDFNNQEDLKVYCASCYMVFEHYNIKQEAFINAVKQCLFAISSKDFIRRPSPYDLLVKLNLIQEQKQLTNEEIAIAEFDKIIKYIKGYGQKDFNDRTKEVLKQYYTNGVDTIEFMLFDNFNQNKKDIVWVRKEFVDYYLAEKQQPSLNNLKIENKKVNNLINNLLKYAE